MPTFNGLSLELQCQQSPDIGGPIEEFAPRPLDPTVDPLNMFMPPVYDAETRIVSVFVPIFAQQQFWLVYSCTPPSTPSGQGRNSLVESPGTPQRSSGGDTSYYQQNIESRELFYVFKMFLGNDELATWSCGPEQEWWGKTVFGMFDTSAHTGGKGLQKRIMIFGSQGPQVSGDLASDRDKERKIEVRVYRADKAMRVPRAMAGSSGGRIGGDGWLVRYVGLLLVMIIWINVYIGLRAEG
jgi:hypothetical protein